MSTCALARVSCKHVFLRNVYSANSLKTAKVLSQCCFSSSVASHMQHTHNQDLADKTTKKQIECLTNLCTIVYDVLKPSDQTKEKHGKVFHDLQQCCEMVWKDEISIVLFGSAANGFGFKSSDLDFRVLIPDKPRSHNMRIAMGKMLFPVLRGHEAFNHSVLLAHKRIPIIFSFHKPTKLELDITFQDLVVNRNTLLLARYAELDKRCQILGFTMKLFTKVWGIASAKDGFLSSYAYTLMVIYYLQQLPQPVLPVLQKIGTPGSVVADDHETWFYDGDLKGVWPAMGANQQSVGELWIGMLHFYGYEFDNSKDSVCIATLDKAKRKVYSQGSLSIRDPFERHRDLGNTIRGSRALIIKEKMKKAFHHFRKPPPPYISTDAQLLRHYFTEPL